MHTTNSLATHLAAQHLCDCCVDAICRDVETRMKRASTDTYDVERRMKRASTETHDALFESLFKATDQYEAEIIATMNAHWERERKIIIANLKKLKKAYVVSKDADDIIDQILPPEGDMADELREEIVQVIARILAEMGQREIERLALEIEFDFTNPEVQKWLKEYVFKFAAKIEADSVEQLRRALLDGLDAGEGIPKITRRINDIFIDWSKSRAEMVARTEAIRAANRGAVEAYKQAGITKKVWITHHSDRTCLFCESLDGKIVGVEENYFDIGDKFTVEDGDKMQTLKLEYEDVGHPPLHPRCRCAIGAYIE